MLPADMGTDVMRPKVMNMLYVTAPENCVKMWKSRRKMLEGKSIKTN